MKRRIFHPVRMIALVEVENRSVSVPIDIEGAAPMVFLDAFARRAVKRQHPHLAGKRIIWLRYQGSRP